MNLKENLHLVKMASVNLLGLTEEKRIKALQALAQALLNHEKEILEANAKDLKAARENNLKSSLIDRLTLTTKSIKAMSDSCLEIAAFKPVVHEIIETQTRADGLMIQKERIPLGVIALIFESRPNVIIDAAALCMKSGNALILKGGKEAQNSNEILFSIAKKISDQFLIQNTLELITTRGEVSDLLQCHDSIDVVIPRGGEALVSMVKEKATMPVIAHDKGLCHLYIHEDADEKMVVEIVLNSKVQRPGVCNALESLLIHENYAHKKTLLEKIHQAGVELRVSTDLLTPAYKLATHDDYMTEYLDLILSVKTVKDLDSAILHIKTHGSHHTEAIISKNKNVIEKFMNSLDASCIAINASTRFNDGAQLGLGAELGISTSKIHAYGPMGVKEMTTSRFIVTGNGHIRK